jgi:thiol-disulfide isomerase/thioredoxin
MRTLSAWLCLAALAVAGEPEYAFAPGIELLYEGTGAYPGGPELKLGCRVWVGRRNEDGTHRTYFAMQGPGETSFFWADMARDGTYAPNPTTRTGAPEHVLPPLPGKDRAIGFKTFSYERKGGAFICREHSIEDRVMGGSRTSTVTLDKGWPKRIEVEAGSAKATLRLATIGRHDASAGLESFFEATRRYEEELDPAILERAIAAATTDAIKAKLRRELSYHAERAEFERQRAAEHGKRLGKPSPEWESEDFAGNRHSIAGYRGKVVVLDFWFRRCGWCLRAMPQLKAVAAHYDDKPVAVLGMNVDRNPTDATFTIEKMALNYPSLRARGVNKQYAVLGYPTLVVIDKQGIVRHYHTGYSEHLREELIALIDKLLAEE